MILDKDENTTTVSQENITLMGFLENLNKKYADIRQDHLIIDLFSFDTLSANDILEFKDLAERHTNAKKSFVLVTGKVAYDDVPDGINVVPTLQEAKDIISMEEIERDLGL